MSNIMRIEKHKKVRQAMREAYKRGDFIEVDRIRKLILDSVDRKTAMKRNSSPQSKAR